MVNENNNKNLFKKSPYIRRFQMIYWVAPLIIIIIAILLSVYAKNWEHFSRAGSLIVIVGIYIAVKDLSGEIYQRTVGKYFKMSEIFEIGDMSQFSKEEIGEFINEAKKVEKTKKENREFVTYASRRFRKMESVLLVSGTVIWGYGDLALNFLWSFNV